MCTINDRSTEKQVSVQTKSWSIGQEKWSDSKVLLQINPLVIYSGIRVVARAEVDILCTYCSCPDL